MISVMNILVIAVSTFWLACELVVLSRKRSKDKNADKRNYIVMYCIQFGTVAAGVILGYYFAFAAFALYNPSPAFPIAGTALLCLGLIVRLSAISRLKEFFTVNIAIRENHRLITEGLYRTIRHPAYTGQLMSFAGLGLLFGNPVSFLVIFIPDLILILMRIRREESMLAESFGQEYTDYRARTKKLIPHIY